VRDDGAEEVLEPRVMQVLVALARANDGIVTRSDLSVSCWENRIVGEDAINRVLSRLRRIPEGIGRDAFRIETITKIGYRLLRANPGDTIATISVPARAEGTGRAGGAAAGGVPAVLVAGGTPARRLWLPASALLIMLVAVGVAIFAKHVAAGPRATRIAVLPFEVISKDEAARGFADALTDQIVTDLNSSEMPAVSRADALALRSADSAERIEALGVALTFDGSVQNDGRTMRIQMHVNDPTQHVAIWSASDQGDIAALDALRTRVTRTVVSVLACSNRALKDNGLTDAALLGRYLRVCDLFVNQNDAKDPKATFELLDNLRILTKMAPNFVAAHSDLAKFEAYLAPLASPDQAAAMRKESAAEAARALELDPKSSDAYLAEEMALPANQWAKRESLLRKGVATDPGWPHTNGFLAQLLMETGRMRESTIYSAHAAAADLQIDWRPASAIMMCEAGLANDTIEDLKSRLAARPGDGNLTRALHSCYLTAGRYQEARAVYPPLAQAALVTETSLVDRLIAAMISRSPADRTEARRQALALAAEPGPYHMGPAITSLAELGFLDDAFAVAARYEPGYPMTGHSSFFFSPSTAPMRRDPRFMPLMTKLGLAGFWRTTGRWPDFCADPGVPYDCKVEAARVGMPAQ